MGSRSYAQGAVAPPWARSVLVAGAAVMSVGTTTFLSYPMIPRQKSTSAALRINDAHRSPASRPMTSYGSRIGSGVSEASGSAIFRAAVATLAVCLVAKRRSSRPAAASAVLPSPAAKASVGMESAFTGSTSATLAPGARASLITRQLKKNADHIYFKRRYHLDARKDRRKQAFGIHYKNMVTKAIYKVHCWVNKMADGRKPCPVTLAEVLEEGKEIMDNACREIDCASVDGIYTAKEVRYYKAKFCKKVLDFAVAKGMKEPVRDEYTPPWESIGYELPMFAIPQEPRPWMLPGWKSPWMLEKEFIKWRETRKVVYEQEKAAAEAAAAEAADTDEDEDEDEDA